MSGPWEKYGASASNDGPWSGATLLSPVAAPAPSEPIGQRINREIRDIPRQLGLTARYGIEGIGDTLDFAATPIRAGLNAVANLARPMPNQETFRPGAFMRIADAIGLPAPQTPIERVVGDASRMMAGAALPVAGAAKFAPMTQGVTQNVLKTFAAQPGMQTLSAASAGGAGGYVRETGGDPLSQTVAALAGGVAAPMAAGGLTRAAQGIKNAAQRFTPPPAQQIDVLISSALKNTAPGVTLGQLGGNVVGQLRQDVGRALQQGNLDEAALQRLVDYRLVGAQPTRAGLTLDPVDVTRQRNLQKLGANSSDTSLQALAQIDNANNRTLIDGLNKLGANAPEDAYAAGQRILGALGARDASKRASIGQLYDLARDTAGRSAELDRAAFAQTANDALDQAMLGGKLPADVRNMMNWIASGQKPVGMHGSVEMPFNVEIAEQLKTRIGELQRATNDRAEQMALGLVRRSLDNTPLRSAPPINPGNLPVAPGLLPPSNAALGQESIDAFNAARRANRTYMETVERTPALQAVRDGIEPDKFVQQFIVGTGNNANAMDVLQLRNALRKDPAAMDSARNAIAGWLKGRALNGAADEVGNFSQAAYNKAIKQLGDRKLSAFFSPEEVAQLKAVGRVASYEQVQPRGSAVNNSNTAGTAMAGVLDFLANNPMLSRIPFATQAIRDPARNWAAQVRINQATNIPGGLLAPVPKALPRPMLPAGLLMAPMLPYQQD